MPTIREIVTKWRYDVDTSGLKNAEGALAKVGKGIAQAQGGAGGTAGLFGDLGKSVLGARAAMLGVWGAIGGTVYGLGKLGKGAIDGATAMEQHQIAFETMLKSADKAKKLIGDIQQFAKTTPFEQDELIQYSKQLLAFGTGANDIIPTMTKLGDIAAGVGKDKLPSIVRAYGRMQVKGRVTMEELNLLLEAGVPILSKLSEGMGVSQEKMYKMIETGKVRFKDVQKALDSLSTGNGMFAGLMIKQSKSMGGVLSNLSDYFSILATQIGTSVLPQVKELALEFLKFFEENEEWIKAEAIEGMKMAIGLMRDLWDFGKGALETYHEFAGVFGTFTDFAKKLYDMSIVKYFMDMYKVLGRLSDAFGIGEKIKSFASNVGWLGKVVSGAMTGISMFVRMPYLLLDDLATYLEGGKSVLGTAIEYFSMLGKKISETFTGVMDNPKKFILEFFTWVGEKIDWFIHKLGDIAGFDWSGVSINNKGGNNGKAPPGTGMIDWIKESVVPKMKIFGEATGMIKDPVLKAVPNQGMISSTGQTGILPSPSLGPIPPKSIPPSFSPGGNLLGPIPPNPLGPVPGGATINNNIKIEANGLSPEAARAVIGAELDRSQKTNLKQLGDMTGRKYAQ